MKKIHYAWVIAFVNCIIAFSTGAQSISVSVFNVPVANGLGISIKTISMVQSVFSIFIVITAPIAAKLFKKIPVKYATCCVVLIQAASLLFNGLAKNVIMLAIGAACLGIALACSTFVLPSILIKTWFVDKAAFALSLVMVVSGIGGVVYTRLGSYIIIGSRNREPSD